MDQLGSINDKYLRKISVLLELCAHTILYHPIFTYLGITGSKELRRMRPEIAQQFNVLRQFLRSDDPHSRLVFLWTPLFSERFWLENGRDLTTGSKEVKSCFLGIRERDRVVNVFDWFFYNNTNPLFRERRVSIQDVRSTERLEESFVFGRRCCNDSVETR
jgi:hypothetical protein